MLTTEKIEEGTAERAVPFSAMAQLSAQIRGKLSSGEYRVEDTKCFCGSDSDIVLTDTDRFNIPHRMVLCKNCGIIRANPRMTEESFDRFYNCEYRHLYDAWEISLNGKISKEPTVRIDGISADMDLMKLCEYFDIKIKTVFEIGCNNGNNLLPFASIGAECYGVDLDLNAISSASIVDKRLLLHGDIDRLLNTGKKADLIILNHVLEHILDLEGFLEKVSQLLKPEGFLFVGVPGLFMFKAHTLWQNAHVWQFTGETLTYLMQCCGYDEYFCNESVQSMWRYTGRKADRKEVPRQVFQMMNDYFNGRPNKMPLVRTFNKFSFKERKENIDKALSYKYPDIAEFIQTMRGKEAIIIGGGPSVNGYEQKIKAMQAKGAVIFCIERMYQWCFDQGITPDFVVCMDACDDVVEGFTRINPDTRHLLATQCRSDVFKLLKGNKNHVFSLPQKGIDQASLWKKYGYEHITVVNTGGSVTIACIGLAMTFGIDKHHIFGFDCHMTNGGYAKGIQGVGLQNGHMEIKVEDRIFTTNAAYFSFAQQFFLLKEMGEREGLLKTVKVYGDSLVKALSQVDIDGDK